MYSRRLPQVTSYDIVEMNPAYDIDHQTDRLAAKTIWMIIKGLAERYR
ncbi:MAG: arginase family protein [Balneolales bacterium]